MKTPSRARTSGESSRRFLPSKSTSPRVTSYDGWPARTFASVDLPEPFGPMMACTSPLLTVRLMPFRISLPSTDAYRLRISNKLFSSEGSQLAAFSRQLRGQSKLTAECGQLTACLPNRALELHSQQARGFDGKLHRQLQENVFTKTVDDQANGVLLRDAALHQIEQLLFADARGRSFVLDLRAIVHDFDIWKSIRARVRTNQHRVAL